MPLTYRERQEKLRIIEDMNVTRMQLCDNVFKLGIARWLEIEVIAIINDRFNEEIKKLKWSMDRRHTNSGRKRPEPRCVHGKPMKGNCLHCGRGIYYQGEAS